MIFNNIHALTKLLLQEHLEKGDHVVDATVGHGKDAIKLLNCIGKSGFLYGFDIQEDAIESAREVMKKDGYSNFKLFLKIHDQMTDEIPKESVKVIMFNLGYLPKADKSVTTLLESTKKAIHSGLTLLKRSGLLIVACYPGHEEGLKEYEGLLTELSDLYQKNYNVFHGHFINQRNNPPAIFVIEKI